MDRLPLRTILIAAAAVLAAAALTAAQILIAEWCGLIRLTPFPGGGDDRVGESSLAVAGWFVAVSASIAVLLARHLALPVRLLTAALATGAGAEAALLTAGFYTDADGVSIMTGTVLGLGMALLTAWLPAAGAGMGLHAGVLWLTAAAGSVAGHPAMLVGFTVDSIIEPGLLTGWGFLPDHGVVTLGALLLFAAVTPAVAHRATGRVRDALLAACAGPPFALALYLPRPQDLVQWHGYAFGLLVLLTPAMLVLSGLSTLIAALWRRARSG
ncbi:hypothetical protein Afil01_64380 [Actinorhabdospora filicis]|uniref:Uncharacterized protein n=1 Tax=Actinorhabdospora filicis TaxID=1785913 RepID=A0A9W6SSH4_9ACTN|nr:hypothetical protein [Actinorhabdospora filicis]GLZ81631.1 hypothetical protein Afil01_64380 [Actinorhabdospora filicis]